jgi:hypothetical protein
MENMNALRENAGSRSDAKRAMQRRNARKTSRTNTLSVLKTDDKHAWRVLAETSLPTNMDRYLVW